MRVCLTLLFSAVSWTLAGQVPIPAPPVAKVSQGSLDELARFLSGSFSSGEQAKGDPKNFSDIRLEIARIWAERKDGVWLYVEQAAAETLAKPYRQRVYHLIALPGWGFQSVIYSFKGEPLAHTGAWKGPDPLRSVTQDDLDARKGCAVFLKYEAGRYAGSTRDNHCESNLRGASYATAEVSISPLEKVTWDRGYDATGKQVWGATQGGYRFKKVSSP